MQLAARLRPAGGATLRIQLSSYLYLRQLALVFAVSLVGRFCKVVRAGVAADNGSGVSMGSTGSRSPYHQYLTVVSASFIVIIANLFYLAGLAPTVPERSAGSLSSMESRRLEEQRSESLPLEERIEAAWPARYSAFQDLGELAPSAMYWIQANVDVSTLGVSPQFLVSMSGARSVKILEESDRSPASGFSTEPSAEGQSLLGHYRIYLYASEPDKVIVYSNSGGIDFIDYRLVGRADALVDIDE